MHRRSRSHAALGTLSLLLLLGPIPAVLAGDISVQAPYVRAVPPGQPNSAAFMRLENQGAADRALVGASSPAAQVVELHTHSADDGIMRMRRIERIALPAGSGATLAPGGLHLMLIGLTAPLTPGDRVTLTLRFDDGEEQQIEAPVRKLAMEQMGQGQPSH